MQTIDVKVSEKITLSLKEAVALTGIGEKKLIQMSKMPDCTFIVYVGAKRMFKRRNLKSIWNRLFQHKLNDVMFSYNSFFYSVDPN